MRLRRLVRGVVLIVALTGLLVPLAYVFGGLLESGWWGQVLHLRHVHHMGPRFKRQAAWGFFPRAKGLLSPSFTDNAWIIRSADGYTLYRADRTWWHVRLADIPSHVREVVIFAEDRRFRQHGGVDGRGLLRAAARTVAGGRQGGSTIPMQVARLSMLRYREPMSRAGERCRQRPDPLGQVSPSLVTQRSCTRLGCSSRG